MIKDERVYILENALFEVNEATDLSKTIISPTWLQLITPGGVHSANNAIFRSIVKPAEIDKQIDEVKALYSAMGVSFRWLVTPLTEPNTTEEKLIEKGFTLSYEAEAMIATADGLISPLPEGAEVRPIKRKDADLYIDTFSRAWELNEGQKQELKRFIEPALEKKSEFHSFVIFLNGEPVGTSLLLECSAGAYMAAAGVVKEFRGLGLYRAMLSARAEAAKRLGHSYLLIHAKKATSAPICRKLGFEWVYDYRVYEFTH